MTAKTWADLVSYTVTEQLQDATGCVLLVDPDGQCVDRVQSHLEQQGWTVVPLDKDPVALRVKYERAFRGCFPAFPEHLILIAPDDDLPFDIFTAHRVIDLSLTRFFPNLDIDVIRGLPDGWLARLHEARNIFAQGEPKNAPASLRFALQSCVGLDLSQRPTFTDYLRLLVTIVSHRWQPSAGIRSILFSLFAPGLDGVTDFPDLVESENVLTKVWSAYQRSLVTHAAMAEPGDSHIANGVNTLAHDTLVQNSFTQLRIDGILPAWQVSQDSQLPAWLKRDIHYFIEPNEFLAHELDQAEKQIPSEHQPWREWEAFAYRWAKLRLAYHDIRSIAPGAERQFVHVQTQVEATFLAWLQANYQALLQYPYLPTPVMVNHLLPYLAATFDISTPHSLAIVVVDGMAIEDWLAVLEIWKSEDLAWQITKQGMIAQIPTLTSISRQALLSGTLPHSFSRSLTHTNSERSLWEEFWEGHGLSRNQTLYMRNLGGNTQDLDDLLQSSLAAPHLHVGVFIVNDLDKMIHSTQETARLQAQLRAWEQRHGYLQKLVARLLEQFDRVIVTSDHGHIEGRGIGDIPLGQVAEEKSSRARIFTRGPEEALLDHAGVLRWPGWGLPDNVAALMPKGLGLFIRKGDRAIGHGGTSLEEVVVPFSVITRK